ncbi:MAG: magnesium transporter [Lentisphaerae bacterium]|nr:magnesium transporter [Lentisphaerota bacterium]
MNSARDSTERRDTHPADLADRLQGLPLEEAVRLLREMPAGKASAVLSEMDSETAAQIARHLEPPLLRTLLQAVSPQQVADIVGRLPEELRSVVLESLSPIESSRVSDLLRYPEDSAGGIMNDRFIALPADITIGDCLARLHEREEEFPQGALYLYVLDADRKLTGVVPVRDLVFRKPNRPLRDIVKTEVVSLRVDDDQEKVADLFSKYHFMALPVLERDGRLVGVVEANRVISVIQNEATEDMQKMAGLSGEEHAYTPWTAAFSGRMTWLLLNLGTAFAAGYVISLFESTIARWTALAFFLPIIAGQGGVVGIQTMTLIIRGMVLGELPLDQAKKALRKELTLGVLNGVIIGLLTGLGGWLWQGNFMLGVVVGAGMLLNMMAAALSGVLVPIGLRRLKIDPALASSIFVTTITDIAGFFFFLGIAALCLRLFG